MGHIRGFASDNNAGVLPEVLDAINNVNIGHTVGYGGDKFTKETIEQFRLVFGVPLDMFFVYNGTGANVVALQAMTRSFNSIICSETAHIHVDECGAPEKHTGCKVLSIETPDGKLTPNLIKKHLHGFGFEHHAQPGVVSITQSTEMGTIYSINELKELCSFVHQQGLLVHMDGARISNAAAALNCSLAATTCDVGIDVLSFGGTKNGLMFGEAVLFFNRELSVNIPFIRKQTAQLHSKMRFVAAQFSAFLNNELWRKHALHANKMANILANEAAKIPGVIITQKVEANGVFAILPKDWISALQQHFFFYVWDESKSEVRWMTSFDTTKEDIMDFVALLFKISQVKQI